MRARMRADGHLHAATRDDTAVHERDRMLDGQVVEQVSSFEIIGSVEDEIGASGGKDEIFRGVKREITDVRLALHAGVDLCNSAGCCDRLGRPFVRIGFGEETLTLEVGLFDDVAVDQAERGHARPCEKIDRRASQRPAANDSNSGVQQLPLSVRPDSGQNDLPGVAVQFMLRFALHAQAYGDRPGPRPARGSA